MKRKLLFILFAIMASIGMLQAEVYSGTCGDNLQWSLNTTTGVLTITGSGAMKDYEMVYIPWYSKRSSIKTIQLPAGLTTIGKDAFSNCSALTSVSIPNSVTTIGMGAFYDCYSLTSVTIPNSVKTIGLLAFGMVPNIVYSGSASGAPWGARYLNGYVEGDIVYRDATKKELLACSRQAMGEITIPNSVTTIESSAFSYCSSLTSVTIPNSVTTIGYEAFRGCSSLSSVTIPNSVTTIGENAFWYCYSLTSVTIPNSVTTIGDYAFYEVPNVIYSGTITNAPLGARSLNGYVEGYLVYRDATKKNILACFVQAKGKITIPNSVTTIGDYAFLGCSSLTSVSIPNSVTTIGERAFLGCSSLSSIIIPNSVTEIKRNAFEGCSSLTSVVIPNSVNWIAWGAFKDCISLTSVTIPNSVTTIGDYAFEGCSSLTSVVIPNSVITIKDNAFEGCSSLTSVTIPNSVTTIGDVAFSGCSSLASVTCEATTPPKIVYYSSAFKGAPTNKAILYVPVNSVEAYKYSSGWREFYNLFPIEPSGGLTGMCGDNLQWSLNVVDSILSITGSGAMYNFSDSNKTSWYNIRFYTKYIQLPVGLTTIGNEAFRNRSWLISVKIPSSVTTIGGYAFSGCSSLTSITCEATTPPPIKATTFEGVSKDYSVLYVPDNSIGLYRTVAGWRDFYDIRPIEANTQSGANVAVPAVTADGATVEWKYVPDANTYTLEIKQNGKVFITLVFNESGQLLSINFNSGSSAPARKAPALPKFANGTTNGWQYTINGLEPNTKYTYTVTAKKDEKVLETKSIEFTTTGTATAVENVLDSSVDGAKKILHNGQIYIITPDGKKYSPTGAAL